MTTQSSKTKASKPVASNGKGGIIVKDELPITDETKVISKLVYDFLEKTIDVTAGAKVDYKVFEAKYNVNSKYNTETGEITVSVSAKGSAGVFGAGGKVVFNLDKANHTVSGIGSGNLELGKDIKISSIVNANINLDANASYSYECRIREDGHIIKTTITNVGLDVNVGGKIDAGISEGSPSGKIELADLNVTDVEDNDSTTGEITNFNETKWNLELTLEETEKLLEQYEGYSDSMDQWRNWAQEVLSNPEGRTPAEINEAEDIIRRQDELGGREILENDIEQIRNAVQELKENPSKELETPLGPKISLELKDTLFLKECLGLEGEPTSDSQSQLNNEQTPPWQLNDDTSAISDDRYEIQPGDTLSTIAERAGISVDELLERNPQLSDPDRINAGDSLNLTGDDGINITDTQKTAAEEQAARFANGDGYADPNVVVSEHQELFDANGDGKLTGDELTEYNLNQNADTGVDADNREVVNHYTVDRNGNGHFTDGVTGEALVHNTRTGETMSREQHNLMEINAGLQSTRVTNQAYDLGGDLFHNRGASDTVIA